MKLKYTLNQKIILVNPYVTDGNPQSLMVQIDSCRFLDDEARVSVFEAVKVGEQERYQSTPLNSLITTPVYFVREYEEDSGRAFDCYYEAQDLLCRLRKRLEAINSDTTVCVDGGMLNKLYAELESVNNYISMIIGLVEDLVPDVKISFIFDSRKSGSSLDTGRYVITLP